MNDDRLTQLTSLEGRQVNLALTDGSRVDDCQLVSAGRRGVAPVWLFSNGSDVFVPVESVIDVWEVSWRAA